MMGCLMVTGVLLVTLLFHPPAAQTQEAAEGRTADNNGWNRECCVMYYTRKIPVQFICEYEMTSSDCPMRGVILFTRKSYRLCANPDDPSIEKIMKSIDDRKFQ